MIRQGWETNQQDDDPVEDASVSGKAAVRAQQRVLDAVAAAQKHIFIFIRLIFFVFSCKYYPVSSNMTASQKHSRSPPVVNKWKTTQLMVFCWLYEALGYKETKHVYIWLCV